MSRAGLVSLIAMMQGCFSPEGGDDDIVGCIEDAACKADRVCRDRQCVAADDDDSEAPDEVPPPDACEWNFDCASSCCKPALVDGDAAGWGECRPADECVPTSCMPAVCELDFCGGALAGDCPVNWYDDGSCDCGCQFADVDCE